MRTTRLRIAAVAFALAIVPSGLRAGDATPDPKTCPLMGTKDCPMGAKAGTGDAAGKHMDDVNRHGDQVMGFDHAKTGHHFTLLPDGGEIRVVANGKDDSASVAMIRTHLETVAKAFARGDFRMPLQIHGQVPPGAATMARLRTALVYHFEPLEAGGRVLILTRNPKAREAVHEFLRFQIRDHQTGDPITIRS